MLYLTHTNLICFDMTYSLLLLLSIFNRVFGHTISLIVKFFIIFHQMYCLDMDQHININIHWQVFLLSNFIALVD